MSYELGEIVKIYCSAWNEFEDEARRALLEKSWTDEGTYSDPRTDLSGREALVQHIGRMQALRPEGKIVLTSDIDSHHHYLRFGWKLVGLEGRTLIEGIDFGELAPDGRLKKIVGFFGALPGAAAQRRHGMCSAADATFRGYIIHPG